MVPTKGWASSLISSSSFLPMTSWKTRISGRSCATSTCGNFSRTFKPHCYENPNHVFPKSQQRDLASKYQIDIPKTNLYYSLWSVLPMRPKARVLALISVMPKLLCALYQMLAAEQLLAGQAAWVALPSVHHGKHHSYWTTILQLSWSGRQSRSTI